MDLLELGDMGSGCADENCSVASGVLEGCLNQECQGDESVFGFMELVCLTAIYIPLMLFGLLGNMLTILVVWLRPHMRSSTYLYLSSMAVSDLLILLLLPLDLYKLWRPRPWPLGDLVCKLTMFLSECCTFCTILHITFLSLERYLAVCWPMTAKTLVTRRRTRTVIGCLWLGAAISAAPVLVMVGVEEVGEEELGLSGWREGEGWTGWDGEQGEFMIDERERGGRTVALMDGGLEGISWEEKGWGERVVDLKGFGEKEEKTRGIGEKYERKQADEGGSKEEGNIEDKGEHQNRVKDEGGGSEEVVNAGLGGEIDMRECRCTAYAASSGLLSAMMILSNLYFLVPFCILGLVYSLIGRTLWLRPQSSRRDQSHRHTIKMLGVIVLAFVLCWLPFQVGRTIFSFTHSEINTVSVDSDINKHTFDKLIETDRRTSTLTATHNNTTHDNTQLHRLTDNADTNCHMQNSTTVLTLNNTHSNTDTNANTHKNQPGCTDASICTNVQNTPNQSPPHAHVVTTTDKYNDNTQDGTHFNDTYTQPDAHAYFLYYLSQYFNMVSSVLFYLSAAINPLLYNLMSARYRHAVHSLIHTHSDTQSSRLRSLTVRHSTTTM